MKAALDLLGNISRALGAVANTSAMAVPMLAISAGLFKLIRGILSFGASTPLLDAGVTLVPGLASQSRVSNNLELRRLFAQDWAKKLELYAVMTDFEPAGIPDPWWKFWRHFRTLPGRVIDLGSDAIFEGRNDLVVDTPSMTRLGAMSIPANRLLDLSDERTVHHCSYFRNKRTVRFLSDVLQV